MAATAAGRFGCRPAPTAARIALPRAALSGTVATATGTPSVSASMTATRRALRHPAAGTQQRRPRAARRPRSARSCPARRRRRFRRRPAAARRGRGGRCAGSGSERGPPPPGTGSCCRGRRSPARDGRRTDARSAVPRQARLRPRRERRRRSRRTRGRPASGTRRRSRRRCSRAPSGRARRGSSSTGYAFGSSSDAVGHHLHGLGRAEDDAPVCRARTRPSRGARSACRPRRRTPACPPGCPVAAAAAAVTAPTGVPASQSGGRIAAGMSSRSRISSDQARRRDVVEHRLARVRVLGDLLAGEEIGDPVVQHEEARHPAAVVMPAEPEVAREREDVGRQRGR